MTDEWTSITVAVPKTAVEAVEFAFNSLDALGTASEFERAGSNEPIEITGYFAHAPNPGDILAGLNDALAVYGLEKTALLSVRSGLVHDQDWLAEWKKYWKPTRIGRFLIAPPWSEIEDSGAVVIRIEPNMAFGTGTHETTQLCLKAIEEEFEADDTLLDVGTGTGILAIAAAKLAERAGTFIACDTDPDSIKIARENAAANGVGTIRFIDGPIDDSYPAFDMVCANLTADVILPILSLLLKKTRRILILSGILAEQQMQITGALTTSGVENYRIEQAGEWISVVVVR